MHEQHTAIESQTCLKRQKTCLFCYLKDQGKTSHTDNDMREGKYAYVQDAYLSNKYILLASNPNNAL